MNNNTNNNTTLDNIKNIDSHVYLDNAATTRTDDDAARACSKAYVRRIRKSLLSSCIRI